MKQTILKLLGNVAFFMAKFSLAQCSSFNGHQPELSQELKNQISVKKEGGHRDYL